MATAFFGGGLDPTSSSARQRAWRDFDPTAEWSPTNRAWRIDKGLFKTDPNRTIAGRGLQLLSRFTWEAPQTVLGNVVSHTHNIAGDVTNVDYYGGATLVNKNESGRGWGLTIGTYIQSKNVVADPYIDTLFRHEYGHTLQSRLVGPLYLTNVGLPSLISAGLEDLGLHQHQRSWFETQANRMAFRYFSSHEPNSLVFDPNTGRGIPWNNNRYPRQYDPDWYWSFAHPPVPFFWWLFF